MNGVECATIEEVTQCVIRAGKVLELSIARRPVSVVLETEIRSHTVHLSL